MVGGFERACSCGTVHKAHFIAGYLTRAGVLYFGHFLGDPREPRQLKPQGKPLQLKAFSTDY